MTHQCFCRDHSELIIPFLVTLQDNCHHFSLSLNQFEVKLLTELQSGNFIVQHSDVLIFLVGGYIKFVLRHIRLMAQSDTSKELNEHLFVRIIIPLQDELSFVIVELVGVDKLIRQVLKREVIVVGFVS